MNDDGIAVANELLGLTRNSTLGVDRKHLIFLE